MDDNTCKEGLDGQILRIEESMKDLEPTSEAYAKASMVLERLYKLKLEDEKVEDSYSERASQRGLENEKMDHEAMLKLEETRQTWIKAGSDIIKGIIGVLANGVWIKAIMNFERTGTISSKSFGFIGKPKIF